jgi:hypothetical protein
MSVLYRARTRLLACCVAAVTAFAALAFTASAGAAQVGNTYLALGDSLAYGYHAAQFKSELESKGYVEPSTFDEGYVNDFGAALKLVNPKLQIIDDGCPGETTETFIDGSGIPGYCAGGPTGTPFPYAFLHHSYTPYTSQLADALAILKENPNVSPITLDIGANDVLQFLGSKCGFPATFTCSPAEIEAEFGHIAANVYSILAQLRAESPDRADRPLQPVSDGAPCTRRRQDNRGAEHGAGESGGGFLEYELRQPRATVQPVDHHRRTGSDRPADDLRVHGDVSGRHVQPDQPQCRHSSDHARLCGDGGRPRG